MNEALIQTIFSMVKDACFSESNHFGRGIFTNHILEVVKHGVRLSRESGADEEIVVLAALLHDYAGIANYALYAEHHLHSAQQAFKILCEQGYPTERARQVAQCIYEHRGSKPKPQQSVESICLASADAMAHITKWPSLLHYAQSANHMNYREAKQWVFSKLSRSWCKMNATARRLVEMDYELAVTHLKSEMAS